jgi:2-C-methyl-D-erythritol 4-phosphate cytidylyltransferase
LALFALVAAAGSGSRLAHETPKQYLPLLGKPMLWHSVRALCAAQPENVFVVLAPTDEEFTRHDWSAFDGRVEPLYCGGETRRDSVYNGLVAASAAADADDFMLVHDAARPCLPRADLERLITECSAERIGGILALPVADTVKRVAKDEAGAQRIAGTEDRPSCGWRRRRRCSAWGCCCKRCARQSAASRTKRGHRAAGTASAHGDRQPREPQSHVC